LCVFFFALGDQSVQGGCAGLSQGWLRDTAWCLALTCLVCWRSPKHVWSWQPVEPVVATWGWWPTCSLNISWCGEARGQGAEVSTLPGASPLPSMTPVSQQGLWFTELMLSASVSQSPFWIFLKTCLCLKELWDVRSAIKSSLRKDKFHVWNGKDKHGSNFHILNQNKRTDVWVAWCKNSRNSLKS
jgi:hypothetical protein